MSGIPTDVVEVKYALLRGGCLWIPLLPFVGWNCDKGNPVSGRVEINQCNEAKGGLPDLNRAYLPKSDFLLFCISDFHQIQCKDNTYSDMSFP
jgi:hypothetical protein